MQSTPGVTFSVKGDGLNGRRFHRFAFERFDVSILVHVYLQTRGEVAERLKVGALSVLLGSGLDSLFLAENLPIVIPSFRVPICRLPTRSLHNLLHQRHGLDRDRPGTRRAAL
jgi:hypothetical protein